MVYLRKYEIIIGSPPYTYEISTPEKVVVPYRAGSPATKDYRTAPSADKAISLSSVHIEAEVNYSSTNSDSNSQNTEIRLFNISPSTQNFIKKNGVVFLKAGFEISDPYTKETAVSTSEGTQEQQADTNLPLLFTGQILKVMTEKEGQDIVTTLVCKDLDFTQKATRISKDFPEGTTYGAVVESLLGEANNNGIPTGFFLKTPLAKMGERAKTGLTVEGNLLEELGTLCSDLGYTCYTSLGKIYIEPIGNKSRYETVVLRPKNIKGQIRREESTEGDSESSESVIEGISVNTFLNGDITTNKMLKIAEGQYAGLYKINSVKHILAYEGDMWDTEIEASAI